MAGEFFPMGFICRDQACVNKTMPVGKDHALPGMSMQLRLIICRSFLPADFTLVSFCTIVDLAWHEVLAGANAAFCHAASLN